MSQNPLQPDDPRLTAYALGELDPTEQEALERLLGDYPAAQAAVVEILELAGLLMSEFRQEPAPGLTVEQRSAILLAEHPAAEAAHETANNVANHSPGLVAMAALPDAPCALPSQRTIRPASNYRITRFASLAAAAALVVVVAVMMSPARPHTELPILLGENGRHPGEVHNLGLQFDALARESEGLGTALSDLSAEQQTFHMSDGTVRFRVNNNSAFAGSLGGVGGPSAGPGGGSGGGLAGGSPSSTAAAAMEPWQVARQEHDVAERGLASKPETLGRSTLAASGKGDMPQDGKPTERYYFGSGKEGGQTRLYVRSGSMEQKGVAKTEPVTAAPTSRGRALGGGAENKPGAADELRAHVRKAQFRAGGLARTDPAAAPALIENGELATLKQRHKEIADKTKPLVDQLSDLEGGGYEGARENLGGRKWNKLNELRLTRPRSEAAGLAAPGTEDYEPIVENPFFSAYEAPLSTFGVDVDTASYANVRRFLTDRQVPPPNAVRIEEFVNYFAYAYPQPAAGQPFSVNVEAANCAWNPGHQLVRIVLKGREIPRDQRPSSNLVFLVDVSGSMQAENKLPLVKFGLNLLTQQMTESDRVAIVTYSDSAVQRLESTNGTNRQRILEVINSLQANGSTNGAAGIQLAYRAALDHFIDGGTNRVILCTDGDFNVGVTSDDELVQLIQERARTKVFFSVFGFGMGNLKDGKLEKLADKGNGHYAYIDGQREAHKMFVDELVGTLVTIAKDVKLQVEFNPHQVGAYRLIGYENRVMASQDFNNDKQDAGEIGAGHTVTALYEVVPADAAPKPELGETLRYRKAVVPQEGELARELLTVKLRYKLPEADVSTLLEFPAAAAGIRNAAVERKAHGVSSTASQEFNWAAAVAAFGMILRNSQFRGQANFDMVLELAQGSKGDDKSGQRAEFIELVKTARAMCLPASSPSAVPTGTTKPPEPPVILTREQAEAKAGVNGKYQNLLRIVPAEGDAATYGSFHEFGRWEGTSYLGLNNLPQGYWVYVAPNWYIWGNSGDKSP